MATNNVINAPIPFSIANGGTAASSMSNTNGTIYYDGSKLATVSPGTSGYVLTSNGSGSAPSFQAAGSGPAGAGSFGAQQATLSVGGVSGDGTIYQVGASTALTNLYDNSSGAWYPGNGSGTGCSYTVATTGVYLFTYNANIATGATPTYIDITISVNGTPYPVSTAPTKNRVANFFGDASYVSLNQTLLLSLSSSDVVTFEFIASGGSANQSQLNQATIFGFQVA